MSIASAREHNDRSETELTYWPTLLCAALLASVIPWYLGGSVADLRPALKVLLTGGVAVSLLLLWARPLRPVSQSALHFASIALLGAVWFTLGGVATPGFLFLFALPVFSAAFASHGWLEYTAAAAALLVVSITAVITSPALSWHVEQLWVHAGNWLPALQAAGGTLDGGGAVNAREDIIVLATFAVATFAVALLGSSAARALSRIERRLDVAARSRTESEQLVSTVLASAGTAELFVSPSSGRILSGNSASTGLLGESVTDRKLLEVLQPDYSEDLERLLESDAGGRLSAKVCRGNGRIRVLDIDVRPALLDGTVVRRVSIGDTTSDCLAAPAMDRLGIAVAVLDPEGRILFASNPFVGLFGDAEGEAAASEALDGRHGLPPGWWNIAPRSHGQVEFTANGLGYSAVIRIAAASPLGGFTYVQTVPEIGP